MQNTGRACGATLSNIMQKFQIEGFTLYLLSHLLVHAVLLTYIQAMETPAGAVCDVICDLVSIDVATEQL